MDGELYVTISIRFGADAADAYGATVKHFQGYFSRCTDVETLTFAEPTRFNFAGSTSRNWIDPYVLKDGSAYFAFVKDEFDKRIYCLSSASLSGVFAQQYQVASPRDVEGPCITKQTNYVAGVPVDRWVLYTDAYRDNVTYAQFADSLAGNTWTVPNAIEVPNPVRHGTVINLATLPEARSAIEGLLRAAIVYQSYPGENYRGTFSLGNGNQILNPVEGVLYRITGANSVVLNISTFTSQFFYLSVASAKVQSGVRIPASSNYAPIDGVADFIGFGRSKETVHKVVLNGTGKYVLEGAGFMS